MAQIYIRSQNKEALYVFNNFQGIEYSTTENHKYRKGGEPPEQIHCLFLSDGCLEELGRYESKERCIEVLDEIQKVCGSYLYAEGSAGLIRGSVPTPPMAADIPHVYQMPEK